MRKRFLVSFCFLAVFSTSAHAVCTPQCIPYARDEVLKITGINAGADGGALELWDNAKIAKRGFGQPRANSLLMLRPFQTYAPTKYGHTVAVTKVEFVSGSSYGGIYNLYVKQSNAGGNCVKQEGWAVYDESKKAVTFKEFGKYKNVTLTALGFAQ